MNKKKKVGCVVLATFLGMILAVCAALGGYLFYLSRRGTFLKGTTINGYEVSEMTPKEVLPLILDDFGKITVVLKEEGQVAFDMTLEELGFYVEEERMLSLLEQALSIQNGSPLELLRSIHSGRQILMDIPSSVKEELFAAKVNADSLLVPRIRNENAVLKQKKDKSFEIQPEVYGTEFADEDLRYEVRSSIGKQLNELYTKSLASCEPLEIDFPESIYRIPEVLSTDSQLHFLMDSYNQYCYVKLVYQFGSEKEVLDFDTVQDWLILENENCYLNEEKMRAFVDELASRYDTRYRSRTFTTTYGSTVTFSGGENEYGYTVNKEAEYAQLLKDLASNTKIKREPVYYTKNSYDNPLFYRREGKDDLAGTYVEVNLAAQHLWFYKNGSLIIESDLVSGCVAKGNETSTGVYPLAYKKSPDVLVGSNANDGYETEVNYWMPFCEGQGLHDATWRGSFGGDIYKTNGSHGCINLPLYAAAAIYENIEPGVAIIIYK